MLTRWLACLCTHPPVVQVRFVSLTQPEVLKGREEMEIRVSADKEKNTIIIE